VRFTDNLFSKEGAAEYRPYRQGKWERARKTGKNSRMERGEGFPLPADLIALSSQNSYFLKISKT